MNVIDVLEITRAAKLRRLCGPCATAAPALPQASVPAADAAPNLTPDFPVSERRGNAPSALQSLMKRHDRIHERHLRNG